MAEILELNNIMDVATITPSYRSLLLECCVFSLAKNNHQPSIPMELIGMKTENYLLAWPTDALHPLAAATHTDQERATELGAECLAFLLVEKTTGLHLYKSFKRKHGGGFDFYLREKIDNSFVTRGRLEVSGIFKGSSAALDSRFTAKSRQTDKSDDSGFPGYVSISEFGTPITKIAPKS